MSLSSWGVVIGLGDKQRRHVFILIIVFCQILDPAVYVIYNKIYNLQMLPIASYLDTHSNQKHALMGKVSSVIFL